jgi:hypothetical protein
MTDLLKLILGVLASLFKSRAKLEAEILVLRQQINVLRRPESQITEWIVSVWPRLIRPARMRSPA